MKKNSDIAPEDVTNMKFDPPLTELECFTGISARARRERERNGSEEEQNLRENLSSSPALEKTTLKQPLESAMGKKNVVLPRDITKEDVQDLKDTLFSSEFDVLVEISRRARKLYKEEAQKLKLSQSEQGETEEEPFNDDDIPIFDPSSPETCNAQKSWIKKPDLMTVDDCKGLEFGPHIPPIHVLFQVACRGKELLIDEEVSMKKASVEEGKEKLILSARREEDFHCPMPEAAAKRQRMLMREKNLKKPLVMENPKRGYVNKRKWYERVDNEIEEEEEKENDEEEEEEEEEEWASRVIKKKKKTSNNKGSKKGVNGNCLDNYMPDLPEEFMDKIRGENGRDVKLVIQKELTKTDLESGQNRLLMPVNQLNRHDFLTENEEQLLLERTPDGRRLKGIGVLFIEPNGDRNLGGLVFKRWIMPKDAGRRNSSTVYVFNGKWHDLCKKHKLKEEMIVQVYSFRYDGGNLGFAMVIVEKVKNGNRKGKGKGNDNIGSGSGSGSQKLRKIGCSVW